MNDDNRILCVSNAYQRKFFINKPYEGLPSQIKDELKILCVLFTEDVGGILTLVFDDEGELNAVSYGDEEDILYDDIGGRAGSSRMKKNHRELFQQLEEYYRVFILGESS